MRIRLTILFALFISGAWGQAKLPVATNFRRAYANQTRDVSGRPGKKYWQNTADYDIKVTFDQGSITGTESIQYINNSPDTLKKVVFKLYPNIFKPTAMRNVVIDDGATGEGVTISTMSLNNKVIDIKKRSVRGTNLYINSVAIAPGATASFNITYNYKLNDTSFIRTGRVENGAYMVAYFFPRIAVYDDIDGWNEYPYLGKEEFYNDYCNFKVAITTPGKNQVWATGDLKNTADVYEPAFAQRIAYAENNDAITDIITEQDLKNGHITKNESGNNTWLFEARNVTDFAFAVSDHYIWKASSVMVDATTKRRTRVDAVYNPQHTNFDPVVNFARKTVEAISFRVPCVPFPYSHQTIFEGLDAMEYPMMVNNLPFDKNDVAYFTAHEIFHALFPFYVGSNETKYSFMDEGPATLAEFTLRPMIEPGAPNGYDLSSVNDIAGSDQDVPVMTLTPQLYGKARFADKDLKPALALHYLKDMLGEKLFYTALKYYINVWKGRHPTPYDFFYCMNAGAKANLNWFWQNWFFEKAIPDLAISKVQRQQNNYTISINNIGKAAVPVHLSVIYQDGYTQTIHRSIECWARGTASLKLTFTAKGKISKLVLGDAYDADIDPSNNVG
ncbi:peptidase [Mucilaginibacter terrenus]|uniref:Peptidase n=1 Tax=Mucilaginibacter terrenus TaxID=2482727 RepID=A0A3E2NKJ8_9SPHI|nr:M1 family metallopeptidase [Mucilaginibacter terrenus]RFZ81463.1 peptidase [Mucilaginibacter terrenus]